MARFIIERNLPQSTVNALGTHKASEAVSAETIAKQANQLATPDKRLTWIATYLTNEKVYSIYEADSAEMLRQAAYCCNYPIHRLLQIHDNKNR